MKTQFHYHTQYQISESYVRHSKFFIFHFFFKIVEKHFFAWELVNYEFHVLDIALNQFVRIYFVMLVPPINVK